MTTILVGVDRTPGSLVALRRALDEARLRDAHLTILYAFTERAPGAAYPVLPDRGERAAEREAAITRERQRLDGWLEGLDLDFAGIEWDVEVVQDHAPRTLVERSRDVDMLVIGARSPRRLARMRLMSVSDRVARAAHCSVLIARSPRGR